jgi:hypothetical protein
MGVASRVSGAVVAAACAATASTGARAADTFGAALREGDLIIDVRSRYEGVDQGGFGVDAEALTNRLRAGFQTAPWNRTEFLIEGVVIDDLVDDYNSTVNGATQYPVVPDPAGAEAINRAAIVNKSLDRTTLTFGRQRLAHDDQRFLGNVGWRQFEQTFDALRAQWSAPKLKVDLSYATQVNRVFGPDSPQGKWEGDFVLANVAQTLPVGTLTFFDYYLDVDGAAASSTNTLGVKLVGAKPLGKLKGTYSIAYARQNEAGANSADVDADYSLLEGGLNFAKLGVALGQEVLGGDGVTAFATPLSTLHAFQGWADKFLGTPAAGIEDRYVKVTYPFPKGGRFTSVALLGFFHDFTAATGGVHFGEEIDLQLVARTERMALTFKYADYRATALFTDTEKLWLSVDYAF